MDDAIATSKASPTSITHTHYEVLVLFCTSICIELWKVNVIDNCFSFRRVMGNINSWIEFYPMKAVSISHQMLKMSCECFNESVYFQMLCWRLNSHCFTHALADLQQPISATVQFHGLVMISTNQKTLTVSVFEDHRPITERQIMLQEIQCSLSCQCCTKPRGFQSVRPTSWFIFQFELNATTCKRTSPNHRSLLLAPTMHHA